MPESIELSKTKYPDVDGLEDGTQIELNAKGKIENLNNNTVKFIISTFDIDVGNKADKEMEKMTGKKKESSSDSSTGEDDF